jgi:LuxR family maltose regulon positive regulatory protein
MPRRLRSEAVRRVARAGAGGARPGTPEQHGRPPARRARLERPTAAPDAIPRPRLLAALDRGLSRPLLLLSTPAGFGKTTLLCQWLESLESRGLPAAWVALDARAGDLTSVVTHLAAALEVVAPETTAGAGALRVLGFPGPPAPVAVGETLAEELLGLRRAVVLVLDDYHTVTDPTVHELFEALLEHPPPRLHLALASRADPPLPLSRLQARGQLVELRGADLRFTRGEAAAFLGQTLGGTADAAAIRLLQARTEGWAAGLRLAGLAFDAQAGGDGRASPRALGAALAGRTQGLAVDFLLDEVLARQPPEVQDFLLRASVVDPLCAPLAAALLEPGGDGRPAGATAAGLLGAVLRANLFLTALGEAGAAPAAGEWAGERPGAGRGGGWYRFHQLFREALGERLLAQAGPDAVAALHARAGAWYAGAGRIEDAVTHLLAAGDAAGAAGLVERHVHPALDAEAWTPLGRWLDLLPPGVFPARPALLLARAWVAHRTGRYEGVPALLQAAQRLLAGGAGGGATAGPEADALLGELDTLHSILRWRAEDAAGTLTRARRALSRLPDDRLLPRALAANYLGVSAAAVEGPAAAVRQLEALLAATPERGSPFARRVLSTVTAVHLLAGALPEAARAAQALLAPGTDPGAEATRGWGHVVLGLAHYEWNDLAAAETHFAAALGGRHAAPFIVVREATLGLAQAQAALGRRGDGEATVARFLAALRRAGGPGQVAVAAAGQVLLALRAGEVAPAEVWLRTTPAPAPGAAPAQATAAVPLTWALALLASGTAGTPGRLAAAVAYLDAVRRAAAGTHQTRREVEALVLYALALRAGGQVAGARQALERALVLAEPGGFVRTFLDPGPALVPVLREAAAAPPTPATGAYAARLLAAAGAPPGPERAEALVGPGGERLSEREAEVLACLARRLSNKEIARELSITVSTVKHHTSSIYGKLGVASRRAAVGRAAETGRLPAP